MSQCKPGFQPLWWETSCNHSSGWKGTPQHLVLLLQESIFQLWNLGQYFRKSSHVLVDVNQARVIFLEQCSHEILYFHVLQREARRSTRYRRYIGSFPVVFWNDVREPSVIIMDLKPRLLWSWEFPKVQVDSTCPVPLSSAVFNPKEGQMISKKLIPYQ